MLTEFYKQIPALLVILPLLSSLIILVINNKIFGRITFLLTNVILFIITVMGFIHHQDINYYFGDWSRPIGIEFKLDILALVSVGLIYFVTSIFACFTFNLLSQKLEDLILPGRRHMAYALFLFVEAGYAGMILTNDIFNFYVFLEVASLSSYPLIVISSNKKSLIAAFEYLVIGTIAATIILVSIGLIFAVVGSLNLYDIYQYFNSHDINIKFAAIFFMVGALIKVAIFPLHIWKIKSYSHTSTIIAGFFISISSITAIMILYKFKFLINLVSNEANHYINMIGFASIIFGSISVYFNDDYKKLVIYSAISSAGYYLILWPYEEYNSLYLFLQILALDAIIKLGLLLFPLSLGKDNLSVRQLFGFAKKYKFSSLALIILLINAACLPPTIGFFNKLSIISDYAAKSFIYVVILSISSLLSALAYLRVARQLVKTSDIENDFELDNLSLLGVVLVNIILIYMIFSANYFQLITQSILAGVR